MKCRSLLSMAIVVSAISASVVVAPRAVLAAPIINHAGLVPTTPALGYPIITDTPTYLAFNPACPQGCVKHREVFVTNQVGRYIVSGGNFFNVELQDGSVLNKRYFAAWNIDTKQIACSNVVFDGEIFAISPGPTADTLFVGGQFTRVTGPDGVQRARTRLVKLKLPDCSIDTTFGSPGANAKIDEFALVGNRLFVGGDFTEIAGQHASTVAELDATTGVVNPAFSFTVTNSLSSRVRAMGISPDGNSLVVAGRFGTIAGNGRTITSPTAVFDITQPQRPQLTAHSSSGYVELKYLTDASVSPDGSLVGLTYGTLTAADFVYLTPTTTAAVTFRWKHFMRNSSFGIGVSNNAVYVGGHFCKVDEGPGSTDVMTPNSLDSCAGAATPRGVWRTKLIAMSLTDGTPLSWNPGQESFTGAREITVIPRGILIGYDGVRTNHVRVGALAFLDLGPAA